jgi:hypothetical protein
MFSNRPKVPLICTCPGPTCKNPKNVLWRHQGCGSKVYLDNRAIVTCPNGDLEDYIFRLRFDCEYRLNGSHKTGYEYGSLQGFFACLSSLQRTQNPPKNFIYEVTQVLMEHQHEFGSQ